MNMKLRSLALLTLLLPASLMAAQTTVVGISSYLDYNTWNGFAMAQSFTTDSNSYSNLNFVLQLANPNATNQGSFSVGLYSGTTTSMGTFIGSLNTTNTSFFTTPSYDSYNFQSINFGNNVGSSSVSLGIEMEKSKGRGWKALNYTRERLA